MISADIQDLRDSWEETSDELQRTREAYASKRAEIFHFAVGVREQRSQKLQFPDFLYFSMMSSLASNSGDIMPNHLYVRIAVIFQIVISMILVGFFVSTIIERLQKYAFADEKAIKTTTQSKRKRRNRNI